MAERRRAPQHAVERLNIKTALQAGVDVVLRGHLHEDEIETVAGISGTALYLAAGAAYQTRKWSNRAIYASLDGDRLTVFPIRYEDSPAPVWTVDPSLFRRDPNYQRTFTIPRLAGSAGPQQGAPVAEQSEKVVVPLFRSNIPARRNLPLIGREKLLESIAAELGEPPGESLLVLRGAPGVGKSELAREFARRHRDRYPGGTFFIDAGSGAATVDLARIGEVTSTSISRLIARCTTRPCGRCCRSAERRPC